MISFEPYNNLMRMFSHSTDEGTGAGAKRLLDVQRELGAGFGRGDNAILSSLYSHCHSTVLGWEAGKGGEKEGKRTGREGMTPKVSVRCRNCRHSISFNQIPPTL